MAGERRWLSLVIAAGISTIHELKVATNMTQIAFKLFSLAAAAGARQLPLQSTNQMADHLTDLRQECH